MDKDEFDMEIDKLNDDAIKALHVEDALDTMIFGPGDKFDAIMRVAMAPDELKPLRLTRQNRREFRIWCAKWWLALAASQGIKIIITGGLLEHDET